MIHPPPPTEETKLPGQRARDLTLSNQALPLRMPDTTRYRNNNLTGVLADVPISNRQKWELVKHGHTSGKAENEMILGDEQALMLFYGGNLKNSRRSIPGDLTPIASFSAFVWHRIKCLEDPSTKKLLPASGRSQGRIPVNVKAEDAYLGALWMSTRDCAMLRRYYPFDLINDLFPHMERSSIGLAFRPRANMDDYPYDYGNGPDLRIGYIRAGANITVLGGEGFDRQLLSMRVVRNFHHHFIEITSGNWDDLVSVLNEPAEISRREERNTQQQVNSSIHRSTFQPPNAMSNISDAYNRLRCNRPVFPPSHLPLPRADKAIIRL